MLAMKMHQKMNLFLDNLYVEKLILICHKIASILINVLKLEVGTGPKVLTG
jgi:hypothetical protein